MKEAKIVQNPKFKVGKPKIKFDGKYFNRRLREVRRSLSKRGY